MTVEDIEEFMREYPGEWLSFPGGWIHPQSAIDILKDEPLEPIDILKRTVPDKS